MSSSSSSSVQGPAQAQGRGAEPNIGTPEWLDWWAARIVAALDEPELPVPLSPRDLAALAAFEERNDELDPLERARYALLLQIKADYDRDLAAYRAFFNIPALEADDDVNMDETNE